MELGTFPEWLSAIGGFLAVAAAAVAWGVSRKLLKLEEVRDEKAGEAAARAQIELVFALGARFPGRDAETCWALFLVNASSKPVYDVCVMSQRLDGSVSNRSLKLGALPPGRYIVPAHPQYGWDGLMDYDRIEERVDLLVKGKGNQMVTSMRLVDARRKPWELVNGTEIREII